MSSLSQLKLDTIPCGYAGLDLTASPDHIEDGYAPYHDNFLLHYNGKMVMRGPITNDYSSSYASAIEHVTGVIIANGQMGIFTANKHATNKAEPWTAWYRVPSGVNLATGKNNGVNGQWTHFRLYPTPLATSMLDVSLTGKHCKGRGARLGGYAWALAYSPGAQTSYTTGAGFSTYGWNGTSSLIFSQAEPASWGSTSAIPFVGGQAIASHLSRLWVLGSNTARNTLYYTDTGGPTTPVPVLADWQDNTTGLTNQIVIGEETADDFGVGLGRVNSDLVIFKRRSVHVLRGYNSATFQVDLASNNLGCLDANTIVEVDGGVYFLSQRGYMFFDGTSFTLVSERVNPELLAIADVTVGDNGTDGSYAVAADIGNNYIMFTIGQQDMTTGALGTYQTKRQCYLFHYPSERWSHFYSDALLSGTPVWVDKIMNQPFILDGKWIYGINMVTQPDTSVIALLYRAREYSQETASYKPIKAKWKSRLISLGTPGYMAQIHRLLVNYRWVTSDAADDATTGYTVTLTRGDGQQLAAPYNVPSMGSPGSYLYRRMNVADNFAEATDAQLSVEYTGPYTSNVVDDAVYDCFIETQVARQRRSS